MMGSWQELDFDIFIFCASAMIEQGGNEFATKTKPPFSNAGNIQQPDIVDKVQAIRPEGYGKRLKFPNMKAFKLAIGMPDLKRM